VTAVRIDVHTHVGVDPAFALSGWWPYANDAAQLVSNMDREGVSHAVCFPMVVPSAFDTRAFIDEDRLALGAGRAPYDLENRALVAELRRTAPERLIPFAMVDPGREASGQRARCSTSQPPMISPSSCTRASIRRIPGPRSATA